MKIKNPTIDEKLRNEKLSFVDLENEYITRLYFESMPEYDPTYKYCYQTSNNKIPHELQSVDGWIRAVIKHMAQRKASHGGGKTNSVLLTIPQLKTETGVNAWLEYAGNKLRKKIRVKTTSKALAT